MLRANVVKQALQRGEPVIGTLLSEVRSPGFVWMVANAQFDFVFIDMEHSSNDLSTVSDLLKVARLAGIVPIVRVPDATYHVIGPVLDAGAMGLMLPRVETRDQVEAFVRSMKYPPLGERGGSTGHAATDYQAASPAELVNHMNEHTLAIIQIERQRAVENLDDLLSVPGVDVALVGPFDLAISLGEPSMSAPAVREAILQVIAAARRHGVAAGIHVGDVETALAWQALGMTMLSCNTDLGFFRTATEQTAAALRRGLGRRHQDGAIKG